MIKQAADNSVPVSTNHILDSKVSGTAALRFEALSAGYGRVLAIKDVTASIAVGKRVALIGPNGAGKSTLFKATVGLLTPSSGQVFINGLPAQQACQAVAYVPQYEDVDWDFPVSVMDVVLMGMARQVGWLRLPNARHRRAAFAALERVGLPDYANRQIGALSGGQKRRVFIARALGQGARILLLDEPFSGVDALAQQTLFDILDALQREGVTVLLATHDLNLVSTYFDELFILNKRKIAYGTPDDVFNPQNLAEAFGRQMAIWRTDDQIVMLTDQHT